jgi:tetratricopeptide (TPR) repeat protein
MKKLLLGRWGVSVIGIIIVVLGLIAARAIISPASSATVTSNQYLQDGIHAFNNNDFKTAIDNANALLAKNPNDVAALIAKAAVLAQEGSITFQEKDFGAQAIAVAQQALAIDPNNSEAWRIIGYSNEIMQNYADAHTAYAKSLALNPKNTLTLSQEAHAYELQGDLKKAASGYRAALAIDKNLDQAQVGLAGILVLTGNLAEALPLLTSASMQSPNVRLRAEAAYTAGQVYGALKDPADAKNFMQSATTIDPTYPLGWAGLGLVLFNEALATSATDSTSTRQHLITTSFQSLQKAISLNKYQSAAYYQYGIELAALGQSKTGATFLNEAAKIVPDDITLNGTEKKVMLSRIKYALTLPAPISK